jgi:RNA polymerase sigma factor FliA
MLQKSHYTNHHCSSRKAGGELRKEDKEQLILQHSDLVKYAALRLASRLPCSVQFDDLFNAGVIGLMDAIDKFDVSLGIQFQSYAKIRIKGAMLDEIRSMDWVPRSLRQKSNELQKVYAGLEQKLGREPADEEMAAHMALSLGEYYKLLEESRIISLLPEDIGNIAQDDQCQYALPSESEELFQRIYRRELKAHLAEAIATLPKKEQLVLALYYQEELTMKEIGKVLGYTESRICQIHTKAVLKLRTRLSRKLKKEDLPDDLEVGVSAF